MPRTRIKIHGLIPVALVVLVAVLVWTQLPREQAEQAESVDTPAPEAVWEGEMVADTADYEMSPNVPEPPQALPQVAVKPVDPMPQPVPVPMPEVKVPEIEVQPEPELAAQPPINAPKPEPEPKPEPKPEPVEILEALTLTGSQSVDEKELLEGLNRTIKSGEWDAYRNQLKLSIDRSVMELTDRISGESLVELNKEPAFYATLLRWKLLKMFPPGLWTSAAQQEGHVEFTRHFFGEAAVMEEILMTVQLEDDVLKVLPMMVNLWNSHSAKPELAVKYFNLNLACAVVFDEPVAYVNQDSESDYAEYSGVDAVSRYDWYVKQNERGYLEVSIDRSPARDLCFVVCAPVTEAELDWAVKEYRSLRRKSWGKTYGEIEYLMERAVEGLNPYESYTLEQIQKEGGICGDQTHFCVNTARAAGIPAIGLSGTTDSGPHAWAAVKIEDDEWSTKIGRINGVSQGSARDPQTGKAINEQDIWMWSSREYRRASRKLDLQRQLWLAQLFGELSRPEWQRMVVQEARRDGEPYPEFWEVLRDSMRNDPDLAGNPKDPKSLERWKNFCDDLKREFKENPRMSGLAVEVEQEHLFPHMELGDIRRQLDRDRRRQEREAAEQVDLITSSLKREAIWIQTKLMEQVRKEERDEEAEEEARQEALLEISRLYDKSLRDYGKSVSGFATMSEDYFAFVKDEKELAPKAVRDIELAFKRVVDTDSNDWFRAKTEVGLHKRICDMYRHVGEDKRADVMERRLERQMERARRGAL